MYALLSVDNFVIKNVGFVVQTGITVNFHFVQIRIFAIFECLQFCS